MPCVIHSNLDGSGSHFVLVHPDADNRENEEMISIRILSFAQ